MYGIILITIWGAVCVAYQIDNLTADLALWANFTTSVVLGDIRFYLEYYILLTFALNEIANATYELFDCQLSLSVTDRDKELQ